jgi:hypothetical protein
MSMALIWHVLAVKLRLKQAKERMQTGKNNGYESDNAKRNPAPRYDEKMFREQEGVLNRFLEYESPNYLSSLMMDV